MARLAGALAGLALAALACSEPSPATRPNVLLYVVDALRADALGHHGNRGNHVNPMAVTPHIDRFAREGVTFERAYASSSWTRASMASIFTGAVPSWHRTEDRDDLFTETLPTLAETFQRAGYHTAFITTNPNVGSFYGFDRGFDQIVELYSRRAPGVVESAELLTRSDEVTERALEWLATAKRPFLLALLTVDPHAPYEPPPAQLEAIAESFVPETSRAYWRMLYSAEVAFNDRSFGQLIAPLRENGTLDETIAVFTSDHGEEFFEHGGNQHGKTLFEEVLHVPLVLRYPRSERVLAGTRIERLVQTTELVPTLLELAGIDAPESLAATSLLAPPSTPPPPFFASLRLDGKLLEAVRDGSWKLIVEPATGEEQLFHLERDPSEAQPLELPDTGESQRARERLAAELTRVPRAPLPREGAATEAGEMPEEVRETLKALGYID